MVRRLSLFAPTVLAAIILLLVLAAEGGLAEPGWSVSTLARVVCGGCLLASIIAGLVPKRADVRQHASITFAIFAVTAIGQSRMIDAPNAIYRVGCVVFAFVVIASWRAPQREARVAAAARPVRTRGRATAFVVLGVAWFAVSALLVRGLPPAGRAVERRVTRYFEGYEPQEDFVGFSSNLQLGSTRGMLKSSKVVMRIDGASVDYLRGAVLDDYDARHQRWSSSLDEDRVDLAATTPSTDTPTRVRMARSAPVAHGSEARWFLPRDACDLRSESGRVKVDQSGIAHPDPPTLANEIAFRSGPECRGKASALPTSAPPGPLDLVLTPRLRKEMARAQRAWTSGVVGERAKLDAIAHALGGYGYSLDVQRTDGIDAVVDLLYVHREGHCELFASAMALLARNEGIPARVIAGYRVTEVNPLTGLSVVRERNAHTWVEAWVDGHWEMWDPTPAVEIQARSSSTGWENATELVAWSTDRVIAFFWDIGLVRAGLGAAALAVVLLIVRRLTQRPRKDTGADRLAIAKPLPAFERIEAALRQVGWARAASEPLEGFARRLGDSDEPWSAEVAAALVHYAQLRYGGIGEESIVAQRLDGLVRLVTRTEVRHPLRASSP